jgi:hypothetical protein
MNFLRIYLLIKKLQYRKSIDTFGLYSHENIYTKKKKELQSLKGKKEYIIRRRRRKNEYTNIDHSSSSDRPSFSNVSLKTVLETILVDSSANE